MKRGFLAAFASFSLLFGMPVPAAHSSFAGRPSLQLQAQVKQLSPTMAYGPLESSYGPLESPVDLKKLLSSLQALQLSGATGAEGEEEGEGALAARLVQAKELLGKYYQHSIVREGEKIAHSSEIREFIGSRVQDLLKGKWKKQSRAIARAIIDESARHKFDPLFLTAVIENESSFNPASVGPVGEVGLMQLRFSTGQWIAHKCGLPWHGKKTLLDPVKNIGLGAAYLSYLRERFDFHGRLYLAAYNMGTTSVNRALERDIWPKAYPVRVMHHYVSLYAQLTDSGH